MSRVPIIGVQMSWARMSGMQLTGVPISGPGELTLKRHTGFGKLPLQFFGGFLQVGEPLAVLADYVFEVCGHCLTPCVRPSRAGSWV
jgi:hypothetical protein